MVWPPRRDCGTVSWPAPFAPPPLSPQLFHTFFQTLVGKVVVVELKNDLAVRGTIHSVDQYMNFKLDGAEVVEKERFPQLVSGRGSSVGGRGHRSACGLLWLWACTAASRPAYPCAGRLHFFCDMCRGVCTRVCGVSVPGLRFAGLIIYPPSCAPSPSCL